MNTKKIRTYYTPFYAFFSALLFIVCSNNAFAQTTEHDNELSKLTNGVVFYSPCEHTAEEEGIYVPHRIPAIVKTSDGIICFADRRYAGGDVGQNKTNFTINSEWGSFDTPWSNGTNGNRIDLMMRKSYDGGETWTGDKRIVQGTDTYGYGDIAVVADCENPANILIMCAAGEESFHTSHGAYSGWLGSDDASFIGVHRITSNDSGETWTDHGAVTDAIYAAAGSDCDGAFFSSGKICQSKTVKVGTHYRLYAALCTKVNYSDAFPTTGKTTYTVVLYSDDFGVTWSRLGGKAITNGDEAKCEELPNGNIVVSSRTEGGRLFNIYNFTTMPTASNPDGAGAWQTQVEGIDANDSGTNGELLLVKTRGFDGTIGVFALQSMPAGPSDDTDRTNLAIYYKKIGDADDNDLADNYTNPTTFAAGWEKAIQVSNTTSAYSSMAFLNDDKTSIGFVYEEDYIELGAGAYDIKYKKFDINEIIEPGSMLKTMAQSDCEEYSWATFFYEQNMTLPDNVTAYVATTIVDRTITLEPIGNVVPANTPVILIDREDRPTIYLTYDGSFTGTLPETNGLVGASEKIEVTDNNYKNYYIVGHGSRHVGLYYPSNRGIASGLAYYPLTNATEQNAAIKSSYSFAFTENKPTDIKQIVNVTEKITGYYNLSGQRMATPRKKGVYIKNGKKYVK